MFLVEQRKLKDIFVGEIFTMKLAEKDGRCSYWASTAQYQGTWHDEKQRLAWQLEARSFDAALRIRKEFGEEKKRILLKEHLDPLRQVYRKLPMLHQAALMAEMIYYLEHGGTKIV